ncbi:dynactin subunit 6-like isoform X2 [Daktulosphaira vitifoliae]|uniref:dynactin subunit 6-like isoform X1 n=1 Tax=Daktulosphaira vitifoliae TaxID=58002 RepID=UPI0021A9EE23|nr:dynactin subunit 6-like isoform X1 [Daktulosphaira vitifoliae]XP_050543232.1 dynactin subunit 6-like isoform X2 [Daktulosphaira vitifoliae]
MSSKVKIGQGAMVCKEIKVKGQVIIGSSTIVHPGVTIIAEAGPIEIGESNIIEEYVTIIHKFQPGYEKSEPKTLKIGSSNVFEVYSTVEGVNSIGDNNIFESKSYVGRNINIGNDCVVGAGCRLTSTVPVEDGICIYGKNCIRQKAYCKPSVPSGHREFLMKLLPSYHLLKKNRSTTEGS